MLVITDMLVITNMLDSIFEPVDPPAPHGARAYKYAVRLQARLYGMPCTYTQPPQTTLLTVPIKNKSKNHAAHGTHKIKRKNNAAHGTYKRKNRK